MAGQEDKPAILNILLDQRARVREDCLTNHKQNSIYRGNKMAPFHMKNAYPDDFKDRRHLVLPLKLKYVGAPPTRADSAAAVARIYEVSLTVTDIIRVHGPPKDGEARVMRLDASSFRLADATPEAERLPLWTLEAHCERHGLEKSLKKWVFWLPHTLEGGEGEGEGGGGSSTESVAAFLRSGGLIMPAILAFTYYTHLTFALDATIARGASQVPYFHDENNSFSDQAFILSRFEPREPHGDTSLVVYRWIPKFWIDLFYVEGVPAQVRQILELSLPPCRPFDRHPTRGLPVTPVPNVLAVQLYACYPRGAPGGGEESETPCAAIGSVQSIDEPRGITPIPHQRMSIHVPNFLQLPCNIEIMTGLDDLRRRNASHIPTMAGVIGYTLSYFEDHSKEGVTENVMLAFESGVSRECPVPVTGILGVLCMRAEDGWTQWRA